VTASIVRGDALSLPLPDGSVDLICTSPPYFGLRSYTDGGQHYPGQLGSEATPAEFVDALLAATREMMRVLKPTGSAFVNLGDKYAGSDGTAGGAASTLACAANGRPRGQRNIALKGTAGRASGAPNKSLIGVPWRYALACIDQLGLILRAEIVLDKRNGLPESVTDRVRRSHEQVFHFVKQPRYYSAVDEIREAHSGPWKSPGSGNPAAAVGPQSRNGHSQWERSREERDVTVRNPLGKLPGSVWEYVSEPLTVPDWLGVDHFAAFATALPRRIIRGWSPPGICVECGEGRRPVVDMRYLSIGDKFAGGTTTAGRHRSGIRMGDGSLATILGYACACTPHTNHEGTGEPHRNGGNNRGADNFRSQGDIGSAHRVGPWREYHFDRWTPAPTRPSVILDPFSGTGTTALVASMLGRIGIGVDLSHDYCRLGVWRTNDPGERARAAQVHKPPPVPQGQSAFDFEDVS